MENMTNLQSDIFKFDDLQLYFGNDYILNEKITIHQPTIGELVDFGESKTMLSILPFTGNPTTYRVQLWDIGIDWNKISEFQLFCILYSLLTPDLTSLIFGNIDFTKLSPYIKQVYDKSVVVLKDDVQGIEIDEILYSHISSYLRHMFNQHPKTEKVKGKYAKQSVIDEDRKLHAKKDNVKSAILPLISAALNHPGFKYNKGDLRNVGIVEFFDSIQRLQIYESTIAFMHGIYSGMVDTSKIDSNKLNEQLNWTRSLHE